MAPTKTLVFIPTYNEADNVEHIYQQVTGLGLETDILFLDDNSPDGTGEIIDKITERNSNTFAIHREGKLGIGSAHKDGIKYAYDNGYEVLITMDCDFTHSPSYILEFIKLSHDADIVIGSRYMQKGSLATWNMFRKSLTHLGHFLTVNLLGMPYDASGAFRLYNLKSIDKGIFSLIISDGYSFFFESLFILHCNKMSVVEFPIELPSRTYGSSKMTFRDAWTSIQFLGKLFVRKLFNYKSLIRK